MAVTGAHNRALPRARVGSRVINLRQEHGFPLQKAGTYFSRKVIIKSGSLRQLTFHIRELPLPRM